MPPRVRLNRPDIARLLKSSEMQRAVGRAAEDIASRVRSSLPAVRHGYTGLGVSVQTTPNGGIRGDRAEAIVVVAPPAPDQVLWPDTAKRFDVVKRVAGEVTR